MVPFELSTEESALVRGGFFRRSRENKGKTNMKQLKFMLAAATAISLATAAQAGADAQLAASTGFEEYTADEVVTTGTRENDATENTPSYFYYDGNTASDNESMVVGATAPAGMDRRPYGTGYFTGTKVGLEKVLKVNTGTDPLLRTIAPVISEPAAQALTADTYVDTLVKFTVTPATDDVDNTAEDKLMVYLKEMTNDVGVVTGTNLVVKAGYLGWSEEGPVFSVKEYATSTVEVEPNQWYRLTVKVLKDVANSEYEYKIQAFTVSINGTELAFAASFDTEVEDVASILNMEVYGESLESGMLISMKAGDTSETSELKAVGFAGEGYVDDLVITTEDPDTPASTGVDFTLALDTGVSAVTWTIAEGGETITATKNYTRIKAGTYTITNVAYEDWYAADGDYQTGSTITVADGQTVTVTAKAVTAADVDVTVPSGTSPETVNAALAWAKAAGKTPAAVEAAGAHFFNNYLLNVDDLSVKPEIEIVEVDASAKPMTIKAKVTDANGSTYEKVIIGDDAQTINAGIKYRAAATLEAFKSATLKDAIGADDKFVQVVVE